MRIGIDARLWSESGVGRYTRNLVSELQRIDTKNEYVLFVLDKDFYSINYQLAGKYKNWKVVRANIRWHTVSEQIRFLPILYRETLDLLHFPYFSVPIFYTKPYVVTIHDLILHHFPTGAASTHNKLFYHLKWFAYRFVISKAAKKAKKIIAVSQATKREIRDHLHVKEEKVVVTYEGVDKQIIGSKEEKEKNLKLGAISKNTYFLYVGNAYPHKNLNRLIKAFNNIQNKGETKLVLVGKEDYFYKKLRNKVKNEGSKDDIIFFGEATDYELSYLYKHALALVMPSIMEGFGLPAVEAMRNGCLVLVSNIESFQEICQDGAIYCDPFDIVDMQLKMEDILTGVKNKKSIMQSALQRSSFFSWEKMAKDTVGIYESCYSLRQS